MLFALVLGGGTIAFIVTSSASNRERNEAIARTESTRVGAQPLGAIRLEKPYRGPSRTPGAPPEAISPSGWVPYTSPGGWSVSFPGPPRVEDISQESMRITMTLAEAPAAGFLVLEGRPKPGWEVKDQQAASDAVLGGYEQDGWKVDRHGQIPFAGYTARKFDMTDGEVTATGLIMVAGPDRLIALVSFDATTDDFDRFAGSFAVVR